MADADIGAWIDSHEAALEAVADGSGVAVQLVRLAAVLVLGGFDDGEVYEQLRAHLVSANGHDDPLRGMPSALVRIRELVEGG